MKKLFLWFRSIGSSVLAGTLLSVPLSAQPKAPSPGEVTWAQGTSHELDNLRMRYQLQLQRDGNKNSDDARDLQRAIEITEGRLPWVISFNFLGGSLSKFLALISKANVVSFSVISAGDQSDLEAMLPPFTLHNASLGTIFDVLHNLLLPQGLTLASTSGSDNQQMVCVLTRHAPAGPKSIEPTLFESFELWPYLDYQSVDDIVSAIRSGWELDPTHSPDALRLKYHPATTILLVSGTPQGITIARTIIAKLRGTSDKQAPMPNKKAIPPPAANK